MNSNRTTKLAYLATSACMCEFFNVSCPNPSPILVIRTVLGFFPQILLWFWWFSTRNCFL